MFRAEGLGQFGFPFLGFFPPGFIPTFSADPFNLTNNGTDLSYGGGVRAGIEWKITPALRVGGSGTTASVNFGAAAEVMRTLGVDLTVDTRRDPLFPRKKA